MYCRKCGQQIPDGSVVCPACGETLGNTQQVDANQQVQPQQNTEQQVPQQSSVDQQVPPQQTVNQQVPPQQTVNQQVPPQCYGYPMPQKKNNKTKIIIGSVIGAVVLIDVIIGILFLTGVFGKNYEGTYKFDSMTDRNGETYTKDSSEVKTWLGDNDIFTINLKSGGKANLSGEMLELVVDHPEEIDFTYEVKGDKITMENTKKGKKFDGTIDDKTITIKMNGTKIVLKKDD